MQTRKHPTLLEEASSLKKGRPWPPAAAGRRSVSTAGGILTAASAEKKPNPRPASQASECQ